MVVGDRRCSKQRGTPRRGIVGKGGQPHNKFVVVTSTCPEQEPQHKHGRAFNPNLWLGLREEMPLM